MGALVISLWLKHSAGNLAKWGSMPRTFDVSSPREQLRLISGAVAATPINSPGAAASLNSVTIAEVQQWLSSALAFIFSWLVLLAIAVITSGKLLSKTIKLTEGSKQLFRISLPRVLTVQAADDEVILGFTGFFITFLSIGFLV